MTKEKSQIEVVGTQDELLTVDEVATQLCVDPTTVRRWITNGTLEAVVLPHQNTRRGYRIRQSTITTLLQTPDVIVEQPS